MSAGAYIGVRRGVALGDEDPGLTPQGSELYNGIIK